MGIVVSAIVATVLSFILFLMIDYYFKKRKQKVLEFMRLKKMYDPILLDKAMRKFWVWPIERLHNDARIG